MRRLEVGAIPVETASLLPRGLYFLSFLALFGKFKSRKLTFECFCAVFLCFFCF